MLRSLDKFFSVPVLITVTTVISITSLFLIFYSRLPDKLPLFYSSPWGQTQLATKEQFFLLPIILILTCLMNSLIAFQLHASQFVLKRILLLSLVLIDIIILITAVKIIWIFM